MYRQCVSHVSQVYLNMNVKNISPTYQINKNYLHTQHVCKQTLASALHRSIALKARVVGSSNFLIVNGNHPRMLHYKWSRNPSCSTHRLKCQRSIGILSYININFKCLKLLSVLSANFESTVNEVYCYDNVHPF